MAEGEDAPPKKRFATLNEEEFKKILYEKDSKNTRRATNSAVRTFHSYLREKDVPESFEELSNSELDQILCKFYAEIRTESGELYKKSSLFAIRHGINRHLSNFPGSKDIVHNKDFTESNKIFAAATKELKRHGKGGVQHYPPVEIVDLQKLYAYFDVNNNVKLQQKVFVDLMLYFGRRGRENIHELKITDFAATTDSGGRLYVYMTRDELTKNHQEDGNSAEGRMYSRNGDSCPVNSFVKYTRHLRGNKCNRLFQRPSSSKNCVKWYDDVPLGHNTIGNFMPVLSVEAELSVRYTNHSLRATSVHVLDNIGNFPGRHIMTVTGDKSETSLKTYTGYTGEEIKKSMSDTISETLRKPAKPSKNRCDLENRSANNGINSPSDVLSITSDLTFEPLSNSQFQNIAKGLSDDEFDDILSNMDMDVSAEKENIPNVSQNSCEQVAQKCVQNVDRVYNGTLNYLAPQPQQLPLPVFNYCSNITINYNFSNQN